MKVLQINKYSWPHYGGIERVVKDIQEVLDGVIEINLLCIDDPSSKSEPNVDQRVFKAKKNFSLFGMPLSWEFITKARYLIKNHDLILVHHPFPLGLLVYKLFGDNKPLIVWYHSDIVRQKFLSKLLSPLFKSVLNSAKRIIVSDQFIAKNSILLQSHLSKITVIPFTQSIHPNKNEQRSDVNSGIQILSVGRLVYYKGFEVLLKAMQGVNASLIIVGDGVLRDKLDKIISDLKLDNVKIVPSQSSLVEFYERADIFVLPSIEISEAFGLVQLEAMSYGLPVINTYLPTAVPTVSINLQTGITVEPNNADALKSAIEQLIKYPNLRKQYGNAGLERVKTTYNIEKFKSNLIKVIDETL